MERLSETSFMWSILPEDTSLRWQHQLLGESRRLSELITLVSSTSQGTYWTRADIE
jgi:hypothetical protein